MRELAQHIVTWQEKDIALEGLASKTRQVGGRPRLILENRELDAVQQVRSRERGVLSGSDIGGDHA
jgi:hypothetical protein